MALLRWPNTFFVAVGLRSWGGAAGHRILLFQYMAQPVVGLYNPAPRGYSLSRFSQ